MAFPDLPQVLIDKIFLLAEIPNIKGMYRHDVCKKKKSSKVQTLFEDQKANLLLQPYAIEKITRENYDKYKWNDGRFLPKSVFYFKDIHGNTVLWTSCNGNDVYRYKEWLEKFDLWKNTEIYKIKRETYIPLNKKRAQCPYDTKIGYRVREEVLISRLLPRPEQNINTKSQLAYLRKQINKKGYSRTFL